MSSDRISSIRKKLPLNQVLSDLLSKLKRRDEYQIFFELVSAEQVPGYYDVIKHPMAFSSMEQKITDNSYQVFQEFKDDFNLMIDNCIFFNPSTSLFYREAIKLRKFFDRIYPSASNSVSSQPISVTQEILTPSQVIRSVTRPASRKKFLKTHLSRRGRKRVTIYRPPVLQSVGLANDIGMSDNPTAADLAVIWEREQQLRMATKRAAEHRVNRDMTKLYPAPFPPHNTCATWFNSSQFYHHYPESLRLFINSMNDTAVNRAIAKIQDIHPQLFQSNAKMFEK